MSFIVPKPKINLPETPEPTPMPDPEDERRRKMAQQDAARKQQAGTTLFEDAGNSQTLG